MDYLVQNINRAKTKKNPVWTNETKIFWVSKTLHCTWSWSRTPQEQPLSVLIVFSPVWRSRSSTRRCLDDLAITAWAQPTFMSEALFFMEKWTNGPVLVSSWHRRSLLASARAQPKVRKVKSGPYRRHKASHSTFLLMEYLFNPARCSPLPVFSNIRNCETV